MTSTLPTGANLQTQTVELTVPASAEYTQIVRLVLSGIGSAMGLNLEEIEDLKLAVGEACYILFAPTATKSEPIRIRAAMDGSRLLIDVRQRRVPLVAPPSFATGGNDGSSIGLMLLKHLVDNVECETGADSVTIRLIKSRAA